MNLHSSSLIFNNILPNQKSEEVSLTWLLWTESLFCSGHCWKMVTNTTNTKFLSEDLELSYFEKVVIGVFWIMIVIIGSGFLIGIIQFDRFGGDPLKRRIVDKVSGGEKYSLYQEILLKYQILKTAIHIFIFLIFGLQSPYSHNQICIFCFWNWYAYLHQLFANIHWCICMGLYFANTSRILLVEILGWICLEECETYRWPIHLNISISIERHGWIIVNYLEHHSGKCNWIFTIVKTWILDWQIFTSYKVSHIFCCKKYHDCN